MLANKNLVWQIYLLKNIFCRRSFKLTEVNYNASTVNTNVELMQMNMDTSIFRDMLHGYVSIQRINKINNKKMMLWSFFNPKKIKQFKTYAVGRTYGIQRGKRATQRLQNGCNTYLATSELSTPLYLYLCSVATPWCPMYPIFYPTRSRSSFLLTILHLERDPAHTREPSFTVSLSKSTLSECKQQIESKFKKKTRRANQNQGIRILRADARESIAEFDTLGLERDDGKTTRASREGRSSLLKSRHSTIW